MPFLKSMIHIVAWSNVGLVLYGLIFTMSYETYFNISSKLTIGCILVYLLIGIFIDYHKSKDSGTGFGLFRYMFKKDKS
ncbi:hypothetical protein [Tenuibacillus multivorans]|uniref:Uncharacterized protein n=1 Tax=Tenuibacillus multivorans TaxID=237069 RepID=A0A1H0ARC0_9BACI|nr:hypothetical protein [Tenuibacillus multivorans]GEL77856.1 hypothetical protein TMU01_20910 [Tenuibacillus multivorans]SDN35931.1 hypothetical protein SAMN05216498_2039 [Tenuibacillus multivorans]